MPEVSLFRLYVLRLLYLMISLFLGSQVGPALIHHTAHWDVMHGVGFATLGALSVLSLLGLRYPLQMLPLIFFEVGWKTIWLLAVALPLILAHQVDPNTQESIKACAIGIVLFPLMVPWGYVFANYVKKRGDRWK